MTRAGERLLLDLPRMRRWIGARFTPPHTLRLLGEGEDFWALIANERRVYRFPKHDAAQARLESEIAVLPRLRHLPCPVPEIDEVGRPDGRDDLERPFVSYPWLHGEPASPATVPNPDALLDQLATFLESLHATPAEAPFTEAVGAPNDPLPEKVAHPVGTRALSFIRDHLVEVPLAFCHEDLGCPHILVEPDTSRITGIIDWGDACFMDPAGDWIGVLVTWPDHVEARLPQDLVARTWAWSIRYGLSDCLETNDPALWRALEARLDRATVSVG